MPPSETRVSALQRQLASSPNDPDLYVELARAFEALACRDEAVGAYLSAARAFERGDAIGAAVGVLGRVLAIEPHHQYARRQFERLSALAAFTEADGVALDGPGPATLTADISWGQGLMPLATADLEEVEADESPEERAHAVAAVPSAPVMALSTADLSFVELMERDDALDGGDDTAVVVRGGDAIFDGTNPELVAPPQGEPTLRFVGPSLSPRLLEQATIDGTVVGQQIFAAGERAADLFQVVEGEVELSWVSPAGNSSFARVEAGAFFGELGLLASGVRTLSAKVTVAGELARVDQARARSLSQREPEFDRLLRRVYRDRLFALAKTASPLLQALSDADVRQLFAVGQPLAVPRGGVVVDRGVRPKGVLLVLLGQLAALDGAGRTEQLITLGQCACQRAFFAQDSCSHALQAESFVQLLVIPGSWLLEAPEAKITRYVLRRQPDAAG